MNIERGGRAPAEKDAVLSEEEEDEEVDSQQDEDFMNNFRVEATQMAQEARGNIRNNGAELNHSKLTEQLMKFLRKGKLSAKNSFNVPMPNLEMLEEFQSRSIDSPRYCRRRGMEEAHICTRSRGQAFRASS